MVCLSSLLHCIFFVYLPMTNNDDCFARPSMAGQGNLTTGSIERPTTNSNGTWPNASELETPTQKNWGDSGPSAADSGETIACQSPPTRPWLAVLWEAFLPKWRPLIFFCCALAPGRDGRFASCMHHGVRRCFRPRHPVQRSANGGANGLCTWHEWLVWWGPACVCPMRLALFSFAMHLTILFPQGKKNKSAKPHQLHRRTLRY